MEISSYRAEVVEDAVCFFALPGKRLYVKVPFLDLKRSIETHFLGADPREIFMHASILEKRESKEEGDARLKLIVQRIKKFSPENDLVCPLARKNFPNLGLAEDEPIANIDDVPSFVPYWGILQDIAGLRHAHEVPDEALFIFAHDTTDLAERAKSRLRFGEIRVCCDVRYSKYQTK